MVDVNKYRQVKSAAKMARNKAGDVTSKEPFHSSPNQESSNLSSFLPFQGEKVHCLSCSVSELRDVHIINIIIYTQKKNILCRKQKYHFQYQPQEIELCQSKHCSS